MSSVFETKDSLALPGGRGRRSRPSAVAPKFRKVVEAIRSGDDAMVENTVISLSQRSRWLSPLAMLVGTFAKLFQEVKLLFTNWRLSLVQIVPAMLIWAAMLDLKVHVFHGRETHVLRGPPLIPIIVVIAAITAASFFLNAVFAFAISQAEDPEIRPACGLANRHKGVVLDWEFGIGLALGFSVMIAQRWGMRWFALILGVVVGIMTLAYLLIPSRLVGVTSTHWRRDKLTAAAIGGAVGAAVCSPPYFLGRIAILMLGSHTLRVLAVFLLLVAVVLQTGAPSSIKAIKMSAKLTVNQATAGSETQAVSPSAPPNA